MANSPIRVTGSDGFRGTLLDPLPQTSSDTARIQTDDGRIVEVPASLLTRTASGSYEVALRAADVGEEAVVPILAEELDVRKRAVPTGGVRVHRQVIEHDEVVEMPLLKERVDVRRVVIEREVDGPQPVRKEGDTTIIPIVEEVLVVHKRFVLKEEVYVTRAVREEVHRETVTLRRQEAEVEHLDESGRAIVRPAVTPAAAAPVEPVVELPTSPSTGRRPRRSILGE